MAKVSALYIYPIKGCAGIEVSGVRLDARGPLLDRHFVVTDETGTFLTQRQLPQMALIRPRLSPTQLVLEAEGMQKLAVPLRGNGGPRKNVRVWDDQVTGESMGRYASEWLSEFLGRRCELFRQADDAVRAVDPKYSPLPSQVSFADGYPMLLVSDASLDALNALLPSAVPMNRFRPNIVVSGTDAYAEDRWSKIRIGEIRVDVVKPCSRCTVPSIDQLTGRASGPEPLAALARYRKRDNKTYFGQNCVHRDFGMLRVGDEISVEQTHEPLAFDAP
jgi:uncharacterized protein YcbX